MAKKQQKKVEKKNSKPAPQKPIEQYEHKDKERLNNPPVGLVDVHTDNGGFKKKKYQYDPHLDPQLQWAGKVEHTSFEVPTVSLHVHERIDSRRIIESVKKEEVASPQMSLFEEQKMPLREAIEFYKHKENWSNRLVAGDSLLVMNSLLEKEGMAGKVQMVFFDPPYGIKYGSNFQPFVNKKDVKDGNDNDLTSEPEMLKAFRDTWELGIHSYLTYLKDRLLLVQGLLHESGSVFVQISDENMHHVRELLDEVFGSENFVSIIPFRKKTMPFGTTYLEQMSDFLIWYSKKKYTKEGTKNTKYYKLFRTQNVEGEFHHCWYELPSGKRVRMTQEQINNHALLPEKARVYRLKSLEPSGIMDSGMFDFEFEGVKYKHPKNGYATTPEGMKRLKDLKRLQAEGNRLTFIMYADENAFASITSPWYDTVGADNKRYVVQTNTEVVKRCLLMTTEPGDLVLDITCGSGTTAVVAENWGRRWITCDTSRVAITLTKQRLITSDFDYYNLSHPSEGVGSGFKYKEFSKVTVGSLANNETASIETLYDQPEYDSGRRRVTGPFTVEAVPAPVARSFEEVDGSNVQSADKSVVRTGETLRQDEWRQELLRTGVRAKNGKIIQFTRVEPLSGTRFLQADAETKESDPKRVVVCFGPEHAPLEQRTVELALEEARTLRPKPEIILFCAFHFDPEARKDIEETNWPGITLLEAQMNPDMLTDDLKKNRSSNESFWLIGQPEVKIKEVKTGSEKGKYIVEVNGFDYYNPKTGTVESGGKGDIAMWMLDHDYDGRSLFPSQVFFPMAGAKEGWSTLARNLRAEIDEEKIVVFSGTVSLPFIAGKNVAIKIIDARGIESLKVIRL